MKRFAVFSGDTYYPAGGAHDLNAIYETEDQARAHDFGGRKPDWAHILDIETGEMRRFDFVNSSRGYGGWEEAPTGPFAE